MFYKIATPFIPPGTKKKIGVSGGSDVLRKFVHEDNIPTYLGGKDDYIFNVEEYFENSEMISDEEALRYREFFPMHT